MQYVCEGSRVLIYTPAELCVIETRIQSPFFSPGAPTRPSSIDPAVRVLDAPDVFVAPDPLAEGLLCLLEGHHRSIQADYDVTCIEGRLLREASDVLHAPSDCFSDISPKLVRRNFDLRYAFRLEAARAGVCTVADLAARMQVGKYRLVS